MKAPLFIRNSDQDSSSNVINCLLKWPFMIVSCIQALMVCHRAASYSDQSLSCDLLRQLSAGGTLLLYHWVHVVHTDKDFPAGRKTRLKIIHRRCQGQVLARISSSLHWSLPVRWPLESRRAKQHMPCWTGCTADLSVIHFSSSKCHNMA